MSAVATRLGSGHERLFSRAPLLGVVIPAWGVEDYLDDCVRSLLAQTHRAVGGGHRRRRRRPTAPARSPTSGRTATTGSASSTPSTAAWARPATSARCRCAATTSPSSTPTTSCRRRRTPTWWARSSESGSDFATGSIVRWEGDAAGRAALDAPAAPAAAGRAGRGPARDPRRRLRLEQGLAALLLGRRRAGVARGRALRGPADDDPVVPRRVASTCSTRSSTTGGSARARSPRRAPRRCRTSPTAGRPSGSRSRRCGRTARPRSSRSSSTGSWPATCGATSCWCPGCAPTSGGGCCAPASWSSGASARSSHSGLPPVHRLAGWLVAEDRRADVIALMEWVADARRAGPAGAGRRHRGLAALGARRGARRDDRAPEALALRDHEVTT